MILSDSSLTAISFQKYIIVLETNTFAFLSGGRLITWDFCADILNKMTWFT